MNDSQMDYTVLREKFRDLTKGDCIQIIEFLAKIYVILNSTLPTIYHFLLKNQGSLSLKDIKMSDNVLKIALLPSFWLAFSKMHELRMVDKCFLVLHLQKFSTFIKYRERSLDQNVYKQTQLWMIYDGAALFLHFRGQSKSGHMAF